MAAPRALDTLIPKLTAQALGRKAAALVTLLEHWPSIMGPEFARHTTPERLAFPRGRQDSAVLHLRVPSALAASLQHAEPHLIQRINGCFGYHAVGRLKLIHGPAPLPARTRRRRTGILAPVDAPPPEAAPPAIRDATAGISDPDLRNALIRLGTAILARQR